jgi:hypothetical protein
VIVATLAVAGVAAGIGQVDAYPTISMAFGWAELGLAAALALLGLVPFAGRRSRMGVRRG